MKNKKGFTIIELLVVITILGLIATIVAVSMGKYRQDVKNKEKNILRQTLIDEFNNYRIDNIDKYLSNSIYFSYDKDSNKIELGKIISFNKVSCNNISSSSITYYYKKDRLSSIDNISETAEIKDKLKNDLKYSKEEVYCIKFYCNGEIVIDDRNELDGNETIETVLINGMKKEVKVNYCR